MGKMAKTVTVEVESLRSHPLYKKIVKKHRKLLVQVGNQEAKVGDEVKIVKVRPISKRKHFVLEEVVR
jgi:small subunit ribosomal protein S17